MVHVLFLIILVTFRVIKVQPSQTLKLIMNASNSLGKQIPKTLMRDFFEVSCENSTFIKTLVFF